MHYVCRMGDTDLVSTIRQLSSGMTKDLMYIEVRREFILEDAIRFSHKKKFDPYKDFKVTLIVYKLRSILLCIDFFISISDKFCGRKCNR